MIVVADAEAVAVLLALSAAIPDALTLGGRTAAALAIVDVDGVCSLEPLAVGPALRSSVPEDDALAGTAVWDGDAVAGPLGDQPLVPVGTADECVATDEAASEGMGVVEAGDAGDPEAVSEPDADGVLAPVDVTSCVGGGVADTLDTADTEEGVHVGDGVST